MFTDIKPDTSINSSLLIKILKKKYELEGSEGEEVRLDMFHPFGSYCKRSFYVSYNGETFDFWCDDDFDYESEDYCSIPAMNTKSYTEKQILNKEIPYYYDSDNWNAYIYSYEFPLFNSE